MPKVNFRVKRLWEELQDLIKPIESRDTQKLLNTVKEWIELNRKILQQGELERSAALVLLLEGKAFEFPMSKPEAGEYLKNLITYEEYLPRTINSLVDTLETIIREFAVFTKWEDCPVCREGYLGYWTNAERNKVILCCPECWWRQDLNGEEWLGKESLFPASIQDLKAQGIIGEYGQHL
jgi:hypothetical protein